MNLETAYFIAQIIAAGAIIGTLLYGILQIKINNRLALVQLTNESQRVISNFNLSIGLDNQVARVWRDGLKGEPSLDRGEKNQFNALITSSFGHYDQHHFLSRKGLIATEELERGERQISFLLSQPGVQRWWPGNKLNFSIDMCKDVDRLLADLESLKTKIDEQS